MSTNLLVLEADLGSAKDTAASAHDECFVVHIATTAGTARELLSQIRFDLILIGSDLRHDVGLTLLDDIERGRDERFALVTFKPPMDRVHHAIISMATECQGTPVDENGLSGFLRRSQRRLARRDDHSDHTTLPGLVSQSAVMHPVIETIKAVARQDLSVLMFGESGTGKNSAAHAMHALSNRPGALVVLHCATVRNEHDANLVFGHEPLAGLFSIGHNVGIFAKAEGGTLFLDNITELPYEAQAYLLRAMDELDTDRANTGSNNARVRIIASATSDPLQAVEAGRLRSDLYFRVADVPICLPPLRDRGDDLVLLANTFIEQLNLQHSGSKILAEDAARWLLNHSWPGNVRELKSAVHRGYYTGVGDAVQLQYVQPEEWIGDSNDDVMSVPVGITFDEIQKRVIQRVLIQCNNDKTATARSLGLSVRTIHNYLARWNKKSTKA